MKVLLFVFALITIHLAVMEFSVAEDYIIVLMNHTCSSDTQCCVQEDKFYVTIPDYMLSSDNRLQVTPGCSYNIPLSIIIECQASNWTLQLTCMGIVMGSANTPCDQTLNEHGDQDCPMQVGHMYTNVWTMTIPTGVPLMDMTCQLAFYADGENSMGTCDVPLRFGDYGCQS